MYHLCSHKLNQALISNVNLNESNSRAFKIKPSIGLEDASQCQSKLN